MKKIVLWVSGVVVIAAAFTGLYVWIERTWINPQVDLDSPEAIAIAATLERVSYLEAVAARTFEVDQFSEVFIDTSDFVPNENQRALIAGIFGSDGHQKAGYLTYKQAFYLSWKAGAEFLQAGRDKTPQAWEVFRNQHGNMVPAYPRYDPIGEIEVAVERITIKGNKAIVRYRTPGYDREATMYKVNSTWLIAKVKNLSVHVESSPMHNYVGTI